MLKIIVKRNVLEENIWLRRPSLWEIRYSMQLDTRIIEFFGVTCSICVHENCCRSKLGNIDCEANV